MLTITNKALSVVRGVTAQPKLDESSALRIAQHRGSRLPGVRAVERPHLATSSPSVPAGVSYVGPNAVRRLRGKPLDVRRDSEGRVDSLA